MRKGVLWSGGVSFSLLRSGGMVVEMMMWCLYVGK